MKSLEAFRDKELVQLLIEEIGRIAPPSVNLMEVCGGHTMAIQKAGLPSLLPPGIRLLSGPGCPVCVTSYDFIDQALALIRKEKVTITTYGDLIRVPGSGGNLAEARALGADIRVVYSLLEAIEMARKEPQKEIVFLGIGFETTAPATAAGLDLAVKEKLRNFSVFSAHKVMIPAMDALLEQGSPIHGYICPGHVSAITGSEVYRHLPSRFGACCVISGFEAVDILESILMLVKQYVSHEPVVEIQYRRVVRPEGNLKARELMDKYFELKDDWWRGLGVIPYSGLKIRPEYAAWNAEEKFGMQAVENKEPPGCICGLVLKGVKTPADCPLFANICQPSDPVGACMVSSEGACHAHYLYREDG
ncbi:MAG TPA: hydrogenase formation protein HypD [Bacteroidales bacterium]|nr:hydrogenase formation protein HypD [Bacteroidales bacterium]HSA42413.1 hydrogenase formation protein HypD [Bacteroidales bacterium]